MRIESLIRRKGGTFIRLDQDIYHFVATPDDPRHVAEVADPAHIQALLAIKEGYRIAKGAEPKPDVSGPGAALPNSASHKSAPHKPGPQMPRKPAMQPDKQATPPTTPKSPATGATGDLGERTSPGSAGK